MNDFHPIALADPRGAQIHAFDPMGGLEAGDGEALRRAYAANFHLVAMARKTMAVYREVSASAFVPALRAWNELTKPTRNNGYSLAATYFGGRVTD